MSETKSPGQRAYEAISPLTGGAFGRALWADLTGIERRVYEDVADAVRSDLVEENERLVALIHELRDAIPKANFLDGLSVRQMNELLARADAELKEAGRYDV